ncbi:MAG: hypothetical protein IKN55_13370 [Oscillospiraceae bacterium]|nr:hypothetical protein [Oscillospiraceae bacterium]
MQHYGGAINTKVKTVTVTDSTFTECVSTLREGGALHLGGIGSGSTATITGSTFINCMAKTGGGAVMASTETLTVRDSFFYGCQAFGEPASNYKYDNANKKNQNGGGAISHSENSRNSSTQNTTTITNCVFTSDPNGDADAQSCSTATNGGAIWTRAKTVTIEQSTIDGCTANNNGGGIYLSKNGSQNATISGIKNPDGETVKGSISHCQANSGSAVYAEDKATFSGELSVSENTVSDVNSGAIQTVNNGMLYFEGNVKVEKNTCSADTVNDHDVLMQINGNTIINTTNNGLGSEARIGVYVSDPNSAYANHGKEGQPFGTYYDSVAGSNYLDSFFNDRDKELYGYQLSVSDTKIYWGIYVCKITDRDGNTLTRPNGKPAVYQTLSMALDEFTRVTGGDAVYIKMLVENYDIRQTTEISNFPAADITLTTAGPDEDYPYRGTPGTVSTISRNNHDKNQLFKLDNPNTTFRLESITLDGRKDKTDTQGSYRLIEVAQGNLVINRGTTMQYGAASLGGGAIDAAAVAHVTINGVYDTDTKEPTVRFINCTVAGGNKPNGGAIRAYDLTITNNTAEKGKYGTAFIDCSAYNGGAITSLGPNMTVNGVLFDSCHTQSAGGAIYHNNFVADTTTTVKNCAFENCYTDGNNWAHGGAIEARTAVLNVEDCSFKDCQATSDGGAVYHGYVDGNNKPSGNRETTSIKNTSFTGCATSGSDNSYNYGGSVYTQAKTVEVIDSSFMNSTATNYGGALYCQTSVNGSAATISGTKFLNCSTSRSEGNGGAIYTNSKALILQDYTPEGSASPIHTTITSCKAPGYSGAVHMANSGSVLTVKDGTVISNCYAKQGGAIYLPAGVTMNLNDSPEFKENGYTTQSGSIVDAEKGACIYLSQGSRINLSGSPKFSRNILPTEPRITNGGITDFVRQDIYLAGYSSVPAASIYVVGELTGDTIWVWPEQSPHRLPNEQFAKIDAEVTVSDDTLSHLRNSLADNVTHCEYGEYLAGIQLGGDNKNVYWDKMYTISFKKIDNKGVTVPDAVFTLYKDMECTEVVATAKSADGIDDTDAQGNLLPRGTVEFESIRIGAYYMKETTAPESFKKNDATYIVLVGTPYLAPNDDNRYLWEGDGPLNVANAATLVARHTTDAGKYYGIFPLDENNKAVLRANLASNTVGIVNIRNDYQVSFMKVDTEGKELPGAAFTIYTQILDSKGQPAVYEDGYPQLMRWSRDGENYPDPVKSADGTDTYKDIYNNRLPKGMVYFRELPLGTYYLLETAYPERNGDGRRTYYAESDRVFRLIVMENNDPNSPEPVIWELSEWKPTEDNKTNYEVLPKDSKGNYTVSNQEVVCKLTDANDTLLYTVGHAVIDNPTSSEETIRMFPAVYATLEEGFAAAQNGTFVYKDRTPANVDELKLKVLKDFTLTSPINYSSPRKLTFTTAETTRTIDDRYVFSTTRTTDTSRALIRRSYSADTSANDGALITLSEGADMTLQNIRLNGQKTAYNGRAIHVAGGSSLTIQSHTQIENFKQEASGASAGETNLKGGAILMDNGTTLNIDGGSSRSAVFADNEVSSSGTPDGGAVAIGENCKVSISNAQFTGNRTTSDPANAGRGGALYTASNVTITITNGVFRNNTSGYGSAVFVENGATAIIDSGIITGNKAGADNGGAVNVGGPLSRLYFQGNPRIFDNGSITNPNEQRNVVLSVDSNEIIWTTANGLTGGKIGIYVIDGDNGTIWKNHGLPGKPFGTWLNTNNLNVFVNDRMLELYGGRNENDESDKLIYWQSDGIDISFMKTDGKGAALSGAEFSLFTDFACTESYDDRKAVSANGTSDRNAKGELLDKGTVLFERIPNGMYFMKETGIPDGYNNSYEKDANGNPIQNIYVVLVGDNMLTVSTPEVAALGLTDEAIQKQTIQGDTELKYAFFLLNSAGKARIDADIAKYGILNLSNETHKVVIRKRNDNADTPTPLIGAEFTIQRRDMSYIINDPAAADPYKFTSLQNGVLSIGQLSDGYYFLHETKAPADYTQTGWFVIRVDSDGAKISALYANFANIPENLNNITYN